MMSGIKVKGGFVVCAQQVFSGVARVVSVHSLPSPFIVPTTTIHASIPDVKMHHA